MTDQVGNYVTETSPDLGNFMTADTKPTAVRVARLLMNVTAGWPGADTSCKQVEARQRPGREIRIRGACSPLDMR